MQVYYQGKAETHTFHPLDFMTYVSLHIPDKGEQIVRYYGWYSNKSRLNDLTHYQKKCRSAWARLIRKTYEVYPLVCPRCQHTMRIIAFIEDDSTIQKILKHLGLWENRSPSPPPSSIIYEEIVHMDEYSTPIHA